MVGPKHRWPQESAGRHDQRRFWNADQPAEGVWPSLGRLRRPLWNAVDRGGNRQRDGSGLGAIWGEDPRYSRAGNSASFKARTGHIIKWTFVAPSRNRELRPAYARYLAVAGNNFLSNTWREQSESDTSHALQRTALGLLARMAGNAWSEFWPDAKQKLFHRR